MAIETFRSRARVIDLLGRQQIADAPTAYFNIKYSSVLERYEKIN